MDTVFTLRSHAFYKGTTLPCQAGWWDVNPLFMHVWRLYTGRCSCQYLKAYSLGIQVPINPLKLLYVFPKPSLELIFSKGLTNNSDEPCIVPAL